MKSVKGLVLLLCLWAVGGYIWWTQYRDAPPTTLRPSTMAQDWPAQKQESWKFQSEQHWLVSEMGRDLAEMVIYAKDPATMVDAALKFSATSPEDDGKFDISAEAAGSEVKQSIALTHHLWAAENFVPWTKRLLETWKVSVPTQTTAPNTELPVTLTREAQGLLAAESQRISKALSEHPLDAELHEEAALLHGSLAMREASGEFYDIRHSLCRMTAHLTVAQALRGKLTVCGQLAEVIQLALVGRHSETLGEIAAFPRELALWANTLRLRCTLDWRTPAQPEKSTLLEQMEHGRALVNSQLDGKLVEFLKTVTASQMPDWARMVMQRNFTVEQGHLFAKESLGHELQDLADDWKSWSGKDLNKEGLITIANDTPSRCVVKTGSDRQAMEVLGWGDLAAFHQRHICESIQRTEYFLRDLWGVPDEAEQFEMVVATELGGLRLAPLVLKRCARDSKSYATAMSGSRALCQQNPEVVTAANWSCLCESSNFGKRGKDMQNALAWYTQALPFGTAYDFYGRYFGFPQLAHMRDDYWNSLLAMCPSDYYVIHGNNYRAMAGHIPFDYAEKCFAKILDYDKKSLMELGRLSENDPAKHAAILGKMAALDPDDYIELGGYLVSHDMEIEAVAAYQAGFEKANDRVDMANNSAWIVNYYYEHGRQDDAVKIASAAAEVFSYKGLQTMGGLMERMGRLKEAETCYKNIAERYNNSGPLEGFYIRYGDQNLDYAAALKQNTKEIYPNGLEKAKLEDFKEAPKDGTVLKTSSALAAQANLAVGDVIVALDDFRVHDMRQYTWVRGLSRHEEMKLIVWKGGKYLEIRANPPNRRFECEMETYEGK